MFEDLRTCRQYKDPINAVILGIEASVLLAKALIAIDVECIQDELSEKMGFPEEITSRRPLMSGVDYMTEGYRLAYEAGKIRAMHFIPKMAQRALFPTNSDIGSPMEKGYDAIDSTEDTVVWVEKVGVDRVYFYWLEVHRLQGGFYQLKCRHSVSRDSGQIVGDRHSTIAAVERDLQNFCADFYNADAEDRQDAYEHQMELDEAESEVNPFC
jgi:hypothetical protein